MLDFDDDTALRPTGERRWDGEIVEGWDTPRGPLGGYVMAILMRGLELAVDDPERQARSVTMHFLRVPEAGPVEVQRRGRARGPLADHGQRPARAGREADRPRARRLLEALGGAALDDESPMPEVPSRRRARGAEPAPGAAAPPAFLERMVMQQRFGEKPFSSADRGEVGGWLGLRRGPPDRRARDRGPRRRLVPGAVAAAGRVRPGADDRPDHPLPLAAAGRGAAAARPLRQPLRPRRLLRRGRRALVAGRHPGRAVAPARAAARAHESPRVAPNRCQSDTRKQRGRPRDRAAPDQRRGHPARRGPPDPALGPAQPRGHELHRRWSTPRSRPSTASEAEQPRVHRRRPRARPGRLRGRQPRLTRSGLS